MVGGHYHDKILSSSGQGKCTFVLETSSHIRHFSQSNRRKNTSLTSRGSCWDSSTWTYLECERKKVRRQLWNLKCWEVALNTHTGHFTVIISKHFHFFVVLELKWSLRLIYYIFNPLNTEFRSRKKTHFLSNISFLDRFSASTVISIEMAKNETFSYCLFCFWNGNCWLRWDLFINGLSFVLFLFFFTFRTFNKVIWTPIPPFFRA